MGNDTLIAELGQQTRLVGDMGDGDDLLHVRGFTEFDMSLGAGRDTVHLTSLISLAYGTLPARIRDFAAGDAGDVFNVSDAIQAYTDGVTNPFASGHLFLRQEGANVVVYLDTDGGRSNTFALATFDNVTLSSLTAANFFGFDPNGAAIGTGQTIRGTIASETIDGTVGSDTIHGSAGDDTIYGYYSGDALYGEAGNDTLYGGGGVDRLEGGDGNDILDGGAQYDTLIGGAGNDTLTGGEWHADYLVGGIGNDVLTERGGNDTMFGGDGDDVIMHSGYGAPVIDGGAGNDLIVVEHSTGQSGIRPTYSFTILAGEGNDEVRFSSHYSGVVSIDLGAGNDRLAVFPRNLFEGQRTLDVLLGTGSDTVVFAELDEYNPGIVVIRDFAAGAGGDSIDVVNSLGSWLTDHMMDWDGQSNPFATGHVKLVQQGSDVLVQFDRDGSDGFEDYQNAEAFTVAILKNVSVASLTAANFDGAAPDGSPLVGRTLVGTADADMLIGTVQDDTISGLGGDDRIEGRAGDDRIDGGDGNDVLIGGDGYDIVLGGSGNDQIEDHGRVDISGGIGNDTITVGRDSYLHSYGIIDGGDGDDVISASMFTDTVPHTDIINAGAGNDIVTYEGRAGPGTAHSVRIDLGSGNDLLNLRAAGTYSNPVITTGAGVDRIVVASGYGIDNGPTQSTNPISIVITDFTPGEGGDIFDMSDYIRHHTYDRIGDNPFAGGYWARLVQVGNDVVLEYSQSTNGRYYKLAIFQNTTVDQFTDYNFGYDLDAPGPEGLTLTAEPGGSNLQGTFLADTFYGGPGQDGIEGRGGNDRVYAGGGDDFIYTSGADVYIDAGDGDDYIEHSGGGTILGGAGDDQIELFTTGAVIDGGAGFDTIFFRDEFYSSTRGVIYDHAIFVATGGFTIAGNAVTSIENLLFLDGTNGYDRIAYGPGYRYNVTLNGRNGNDMLQGGDLNDVLTGGYGQDRLFGFDGDDQVSGDEGDDELFGGNGRDVLMGGFGNDSLYGNDGDDELFGSNGNDFLRGNAGADMIDGGFGADDIGGGDGDDILTLHLSNGDSVSGGNGFDRLVFYTLEGNQPFYADFSAIWTGGVGQTWGGTFTVTQIESIEAALGSGNDTLIVGAYFNYAVELDGGAGNDVLGGGNQRDVMRGGQGDDRLYGYGGDDEIYGDAYSGPDGNDTIHGGNGDDWLLGQGGVDWLHGEQGDDLLSGGAGNDRLLGGAGNDTLNGGEGNDVLAGGAGRNAIYGGAGNDLIRLDVQRTEDSIIDGGAGYDVLRSWRDNAQIVWTGGNITGIEEVDATGIAAFYFVGTDLGDYWNITELNGPISTGPWLRGKIIFDAGAGNDTIVGKDGRQDLRGGAGDDVINGRGGADLMSGGSGDDVYYVDDGGDVVTELFGEGRDEVRASVNFTLAANVENLTLLAGAANGTGNDLANTITGNDANNTIRGEAGDDTLDGGQGADTLEGGLGNDFLSGGWGDDQLDGGDGDDTVYGFLGKDIIRGGAGADLLFGEDGDDTIYGGTEADQVVGGIGQDTLYGEAGDDLVMGEDGNDIVSGDDGDDWLEGGFGNDTLNGGDGSDLLRGDEGDDVLNGGGGNDHIFGGDGRDTMTGGAGADSFYALGSETPPGTTASTADRITDFSKAQGDRIVLDAIDANVNAAGDQAFTWLGTGAFTRVAGQLRYAQEGGNTMVYGDVDGDGVADFAIRLDGLINLSAGDFVL